MKLVELLAKELDAWPAGNPALVQGSFGQVYICGGGPIMLEAKKADDWELAEVTCAQWQAERDKQKGGEWKRHRGGKCPVKAGTQVSTKHRDGKVVEVHHHTAQTGSSIASLNGVWKHNGDSFDIMSYRVISQPQAEEVEVKDTTIGTLSYKVEIDTTEASQAIDELAAKWDQIETPFKWRDEVTELNAYIEKYTREREALINRLALEGFALIPAMTAVMGVADVDMGDWRNWKVGDIVRVTGSDEIEDGDYPIRTVERSGYEGGLPVAVADNGSSSWPDIHEMKFIRLP